MGFLASLPAWACSVPVFRYALEHWAADPFQAVVFHRGALTGPQQTSARELGAEGLAGRLHANISVRTIDLDRDPTRDAFGELPWLTVKFPQATRLKESIYSGPLDAQAIEQLLDSPARREIAARLAQGESAVWVLLESGDRGKDTAAADLLESRLTYLATVLELPKLDAQDIANGLVSVAQEDLRLAFSTFHLSREDADEKLFVRMLLSAEADLSGAHEPIVFPVFGRGRALYALVGAGIKSETIDRAATFLIGKCSCQVKEQNPGVDLLLAANWEEAIRAQSAGAPDLPALADLTKSAPVTVTISSSDLGTRPSANEFPNSKVSPGNPLIAGGIAALLISIGAFMVFRFIGRP